MTRRAARALAAALAAALLAPSAFAGAANLKDGRWRIAYEVDIPMRGPDTGPIVRELCLKSEEIKQIVTPPNSICRMVDVVSTERSLSWKVQCDPPVVATGEGHLEFRGERFDGSVVTVGGPPQRMRVTQKMAGRYVGPCVPKSVPARPEGNLRKYDED